MADLTIIKDKLEMQLNEKEKTIENLNIKVKKEEERAREPEYLHSALRDMVYNVMGDTAGVSPPVSPMESRSRRTRSVSPERVNRRMTESTLKTVQNAFSKNQQQINDLTDKLRQAQNQLADMKRRVEEKDADRARLEKDVSMSKDRINNV